MKRLGLVVIALFVLLTLCGANANAASVGTWHTYREDISCSTGNADIDTTITTFCTSTNVTHFNTTLPCNLLNLSQSDTNFTIYNTGNPGAVFNLTVNNKIVNCTSVITSGVEINVPLSAWITAGVTNTDEFLNVSFDVNVSTAVVGINITGTNVEFTSTFLALLTIKEKDITRLPYIGTTSTNSIHAVNNSFNISSTALWFTISDVVFNLTFPAHKTSTPTTTFQATNIANNGSYQNYTQYQKYGPYVYDVDEDVDGTTHEVTIKIKGREVLTNCVQWELDPDDSVYDEVFDELNDDDLEIELNSADFDDWEWDEDDELLIFEDFTVREGFSNNKFVFTWTEPEEPSAPAEKSIWEQISDWFFGDVSGFPVWGIFVIAIVIIVIVGYVYWPRPSDKKKS